MMRYNNIARATAIARRHYYVIVIAQNKEIRVHECLIMTWRISNQSMD